MTLERDTNTSWKRVVAKEGTEPIQLKAVPRIGLVLSSGGARGLAHIGVLQVLEENHVPIFALAGCSMGAYVGGLWAAGLHVEELGKRAAEIKDRRALKNLLDFALPPAKGLVYGERLREHLERDLKGVNFDSLRLPTFIVGTDLDSLHAHVFKSGNVARAIHASAAIPGVCVPVAWEGHRFTDGGASEPLPVTLLREQLALDYVIAVNVMPPAEEAFARPDALGMRKPHWLRRLFYWLIRPVNLLADGNVLDTFRRALMSAQLRLIAKEAQRADVLIQPRFGHSRWYDFENFESYIAAGRRAALDALPEIMKLVHQQPEHSHENVHPSTQVGIDAA